jgi:hypothetical protein
MKAPRRIELDFAAPPQVRSGTGFVLCAAGLVACGALGLAFHSSLAERELLDARVSSIARPHRVARPADDKEAQAVTAIEHELAIPWSRLLAELESASQDVSSTIALLQVEPDASKHQVRITAEARTLPDALAYLERLQKSSVLRFPMLDSHELRKDDPEHPIRVKLTAEWRT